jgi:hypothetical protein
MPMKVETVVAWRTEVENAPGAMSRALRPLAEKDLAVVIGNQGRIVDIAPVQGKKAEAAAREAGFAPLSAPMVLVRGKNRPGVCHSITRALGQAGISMDSLVGLAGGREFRILIGFASEDLALRAVAAIKEALRSGIGQGEKSGRG